VTAWLPRLSSCQEGQAQRFTADENWFNGRRSRILLLNQQNSTRNRWNADLGDKKELGE